MATSIRDGSFEEQVLRSSLPVVVDFWAPGCGPCGTMGRMLQKLGDEYDGKLKFCKINVNCNDEWASKYRIECIPTLLFFKQGKLAGRSVGAISEDTLRSRLHRWASK